MLLNVKTYKKAMIKQYNNDESIEIQIKITKYRAQKQTQQISVTNPQQRPKGHSIQEGQCFHKWYQKTWIFKCKKMKVVRDLTPSTNSNSNWVLESNVKCETIQHVKETMRENLCDNQFGDQFFDSTPKSWSIKQTNKKMITWNALKFITPAVWKTLLREQKTRH